MDTPIPRLAALHPGGARRLRLVAAVAALALLPARAVLAEEATELFEEAGVPIFGAGNIAAEAGNRWQGQSDLDGGGSVEVDRYDVGLGTRTELGDSLLWHNSAFFGVSDYDFGGGIGFAGLNPWNTILNLRFGSRVVHSLDEHWGVGAGGVVMFTPESGANWGDGTTGGGSFSLEYRSGETFFVSLGLAVLSEIASDVQVAPAIAMSWLPHPKWAVRVGAVPAAGGTGSAVELVYRAFDPLDVALGVLYHERRFRLDGAGVAPGGVGTDDNLPVRLRLGWDVTERITLHGVAGVVLAGTLRLEDRNGFFIAQRDYDPAPYLGLRVSGRF